MNEKQLFELPSLWVNPVLTIQRKDGSLIEVELICFEATKKIDKAVTRLSMK